MEEEKSKNKKYPSGRPVPADTSSFEKKDQKGLPAVKLEETKKEKEEKRKKESRKRRRWITLTVTVFILATIGFFGYKAWDAARKIITDNRSGGSPFLKFFDKTKAEELKGEGDGRINILLLGIADSGHPGKDLSDTIMVVSVDPINKGMAMLSIPRDLYVPLPTGGSAKINAAHAFGEEYHRDEGGGPALAKETVSNILDLPIHYFIRLNFQGFKDLVDEVGGIDIEVKKDIYDPYYPNDKTFRYEPYRISAGEHHMNGDAALKYARSRYSTSDFDRAGRQQQILVALRQKAISLNVMLNPKKISDILNILKDNLKTDMQFWEIEKFAELMQDVESETIVHRVLDNSKEGLLYSGMVNGTFVLLPRGDDFSEIQKLSREIFIEPYILREKARIKILNGTLRGGLAASLKDELESFGYNIVKVGDAKNKGSYSQTKIIDYSKGEKPFTVQLLSKRISGAQLLSQEPKGEAEADIVIIIGNNYQP